MGAVRTVVFDLGGVLVDWNPRYLLRDVMPGREEEMERLIAEALTRRNAGHGGRRTAVTDDKG